MDFKTQLALDSGVHFSTGYEPKDLTKASFAKIAQDADLITSPNAGIPALFTTYVDPRVLQVLVEPMKAGVIFGETQKGSWVDDFLKFPVAESVGEVSSYGDYNNNGMASANANWLNREPYHYQVHVQVGEREIERAAAGKLDWVAQKQISAALALNKFQNQSYFYGIAGLMNYGIVNDPDLLPAIPGTAWSAMPADAIFTEIQKLFAQLIKQTGGLIDRSEAMILLLSPQMEANFVKTNQYGINVSDLLKKNFPGLEVETAPEMATTAGQDVKLIVKSYQGVDTVEPTFTEKMRVHRMVMDTSSWKQKRSQGTVGTMIYRPFMIASLLAAA